MAGERFLHLRNYLGLSQQQFAQKIGYTTGYISKIEQGLRTPEQKFLEAVYKVFSIDPDWLMSGSGSMFTTTETHSVDMEHISDRIRILRKGRGLNQMAFAELVGCSVNSVRSMEIGRMKPSHKMLHRIALACDISYGWLLSGVEGEEPL